MNGKRKRRVRKGFATKKAASEAMAKLRVEINERGFVEPSRATIRSYADRWLLSSRTRVKPSTWAGYSSVVRNQISPRIGDVPIQQLSAAELRATYAAMIADGLSPQSAKNAHIIIRKMLNDAVRDGLIRSNPAAGRGIFDIRVPKSEIEVWSAKQVRAFLASLDGHRFQTLFTIALATGMRRGELLAARWSDLDGSAFIVRRSVTKSADGLVETEPKSGRARRVDLDPRTMAILEAHRSGQVRFLDSDLIFGHEIHGGFLDPDVVSKAWAIAVAEADLPAISFHGARHTHAANLLRARVPANVVQQRLGHSTAGFTLSTYGHLVPDQGAEAAAVFAEAMFGS